MKKFCVTGMSCAACVARVEKAVREVSGVESCSVNLLTNSMGVYGTASEKDIIEAVEKAGYRASPEGNNNEVNSLSDTETPLLKKRLSLSLLFLAVLMYFSMGHTMWNFPLPAFFHESPLAIAVVQMVLCIAVMIINRKFFINGFKGIINRSPNMDTLVALGSSASFIYSIAVVIGMIRKMPFATVHELYFESAAMILALITVGKMLEARAKGKTTSALKSLMALTPKTAIIIKDGVETEVLASEIKKGDVFIVKPGASIPADGIVLEGSCAVDESMLTGESLPVDKKEGDSISAATINLSGYIKCEATRVAEDTTLSQIIKAVSDASATKAPIAKAADKVSGVFVPIVIIIAVITTFVWLLTGSSVGYSLARGISVLVISCPCALGLATPVAIMVGSGKGAKCGILFKTAAAIETIAKCDVAVLDKTGTVTEGKPEVTDVVCESESEAELLTLAGSLETKSEHPLAKAVLTYTEKFPKKECSDFEIFSGNGLWGKIDGQFVFGGNLSFVSKKAEVSKSLKAKAETFAEQGKTPLFFGKEDKILGIIAVADKIKEDSKEAIYELKGMGFNPVIILTGDNKKTAQAVKEKVGADEVIAEVLPDGKAEVVKKLKSEGRKVLMVGDGINDAVALTLADSGIAIGAGTDVAIDAADIVISGNKLKDVTSAVRLGRATLKNIYENLFWAFIYNGIGIPLAAGVFIPVLGWEMSPMFGAFAMSLSSFCVVSNALRLNLVDIKNPKKDRKIRRKAEKEVENMEKIIKIEGMMCPHCEAHVKKALENIDGVLEALPSHEQNKAVIKLTKEVSFEVLKKAVEDAGYTVLD